MQLLFAWFAYHALNNQRHFGTLLFSSFLANALVAGWAGGFGRQGASVPSSSSSPVFVSGAPTAKPAKLTIKMSGTADELFDDRLENENNRKESEIIDLQTHTQRKSPSDVLSHISEACQSLGVDSHDVYGDFSSDEKESYLRKFEAEVAHHFGKEDAVFCLSGGMAQSIALMIHSRNYSSRNFGNNLNVEKKETFAFACHPTSHLLLHENDAFWELLGMEAVVVSPEKESYHYDPELLKLKGCLGMEPVRLSHVHKMFHELDTSRDEHASSPDESSLQSASAPATPVISYPNRKAIDCINIFTLMLELPHREIGGKLTPWAEVQDISALCRERGIRFHCDGARIFEASVGYGHRSLQQTAQPFDSVYISFYKGIGALSGAMLMGDKDFCSEARVWLRRMGGNLFSVLPYAISSWDGFRKNCLISDDEDSVETSGVTKHVMLRYDKQILDNRRQKLSNIIELLKADANIATIVEFDPAVPETNIVHGYLRMTLDQCMKALEKVEHSTGIRVLGRMRSCCDGNLDKDRSDGAIQESESSFGCRFEWTIGESNGLIEDKYFVLGWKEFSKVASNIKTQIN